MTLHLFNVSILGVNKEVIQQIQNKVCGIFWSIKHPTSFGFGFVRLRNRMKATRIIAYVLIGLSLPQN